MDDGLASYAVPVAVASVAAAFDLRWRRIPNWLTFGALAVGLSVQGVRSGPGGVAVALAGAALGLLVLWPLYLIRAMGAGDLKLLSALGALLGPVSLVSVAVYAALTGGLISIVVLAQRRQLRRSLVDMVTNPLGMRRCGAKAPYGVAIASGVYLSMLLPGVIG
jgi:prepilin peptidase CpaA